MAKPKAKRDWVVIITTVIVALLLCTVLVDLAWRFFFSSESTTLHLVERPPLETGIGIAGTLFGQPPAAVAPQQAPLDIKLYGTLAGNRRSSTYALFILNGDRREVFKVGDEVAPGYILREVDPAYVILESPKGNIELPIIEEKIAQGGSANNFAPRPAARPNPPVTLEPQPANPAPTPPTPTPVPTSPSNGNSTNPATSNRIDIFGTGNSQPSNGNTSRPNISPSNTAPIAEPDFSGPQPVIDQGPEDTRG